MKLYLSSFLLGSDTDALKALMPENPRIGYIPNALDFTGADRNQCDSFVAQGMADFNALGFDAQLLDLKDYFGAPDTLAVKLAALGSVWVNGGNVFVLRQALRLSGFDALMPSLQTRDDFLYGGYSAGACVLSPSLEAYQIVDDATDTPYGDLCAPIMAGLNILDFAFLPHYQSDHPEADLIDREIDYCQKKNIPYKALRDGDVLIYAEKRAGPKERFFPPPS